VEGYYERGNELSGSISAGKLLNSCTTGIFSRKTLSSQDLDYTAWIKAELVNNGSGRKRL
jgi:hypothetical protein